MMDTYADVSQRRAMKQGYIGNVLSPKLAELLSIAFDASVTHMYLQARAGTSKQP